MVGDDRAFRPEESPRPPSHEPLGPAMQRSLVFVPLAASCLALSATAQTGRTMKLMAPVVLGQTASVVMEHPPALAGHLFAMAMCSPSYPGAMLSTFPK